MEEPLAIAIQHGAHDLIRALGPHLEMPIDDIQLLRAAGLRGDIESFEGLIRCGVKFDAPKCGMNILHFAATDGWPKPAFEAILSIASSAGHGQEGIRCLACQQSDDSGMNPLDMAVMKGHLQLADLLRGLGSDAVSPHIKTEHESHTTGPLTLLGLFCLMRRSLPSNISTSGVMQWLLSCDQSPVTQPSHNLTVFHSVWGLWSEIVEKSKSQLKDNRSCTDPHP